MQLLNHSLGLGVALAVLITVGTVLATQSAGRSVSHADHELAPDTEPDSNRSLWSLDVDGADARGIHNWSTDGSPRDALAARTDVPFNRPPKAVADWNRQNLDSFPRSDRDESVFPPDADLHHGRFVRDAYIEIFTVQPSTKAKLSPSDQPHYVASDGTLLATRDFRIQLPDDIRSPVGNVTWNLTAKEVTETRLYVDGEEEATGSGTRTPRLDYSLDDSPGTAETLTVKANVSVSVGRLQTSCVLFNQSGNCTQWRTTFETINETVTVSDSTNVTEYDLTIGGYHARYPNGDLGFVMFRTHPWLAYRLPEGEVNGVWRFYSARDPGWDELVTSTETGANRSHSPVHPLQIHAYPIKTGPTASPGDTASILEVYGVQKDPPTLPDAVNLDALERPYTASYGVATRLATPDQDVSDVTAYGLVRGVRAEPEPELVEDVTIRRSNLTLDVLNTTERNATVRVTLQDAATGEPIETDHEREYVLLNGERVQTGEDGTLTTTIPRPAGAIDARYEPPQWWYQTTAYVSDADAVSVQGTALQIVRTLYRAGIPVGLFLLAVFLIDRITGMPVWPPWRGL